MKRFKVGIVGLGKVAHLHAQALKEIENAEFTAGCSRDMAKAESYCAGYGAAPYDSISAMVSENDIDLVIICTPHPNHLEPTVEAMEAGAHVLVDKPLASTLQDCDGMIEASHRTNRKLGVISQRRWYPPTLRVKQAINDGKIGKPVMGTVNMLGWRGEDYYQSDEWRGTWDLEGGGVLVNQAPHQLDVFCWLMGPIDEVYGHWANLNHPYIEVEDTALAIVKFKSGAIGNIIASNSQKPGLFGKIQVHGENGASVGVQTEGGAMFIAGMAPILEPPVNDLWTIPGEEGLLEEFIKEDNELFEKVDPTVYFIRLQIEEYLDALESGREPLVNGEEGRKSVELFTAIYRSTRDNRPVKFPLDHETDRNDLDGRLK